MKVNNATGIRNLCEIAAHLLQTMPVNAATKFAVRTLLREAVNKSCPGYRGNDNKKNVRYVSLAARQALKHGKGPVIADHAVPLSVLLDKVYRRKKIDTDQLVRLVSAYSCMVLITRDEDTCLRNAGLVKSMPPDWDTKDVLARYSHAGIRIRPNLPVNPKRSGSRLSTRARQL